MVVEFEKKNDKPFRVIRITFQGRVSSETILTEQVIRMESTLRKLVEVMEGMEFFYNITQNLQDPGPGDQVAVYKVVKVLDDGKWGVLNIPVPYTGGHGPAGYEAPKKKKKK